MYTLQSPILNMMHHFIDVASLRTYPTAQAMHLLIIDITNSVSLHNGYSFIHMVLLMWA